MKAGPPVEEAMAKLLSARTEVERFKILVDLYDVGHSDGVDWADDMRDRTMGR